MFSGIVDVLLAAVGLALCLLNIRKGTTGRGKIASRLGFFGVYVLTLGLIAMLLVSLVAEGRFWYQAPIIALVIIEIDDFLNGNDPPTRRRRAWLKNKFAKLVPVHNR